MPELWARAPDATNRKFRELFAQDGTGVNRKLKELWARDGAGVNRKIFSGAIKWTTNGFVSGTGVANGGANYDAAFVTYTNQGQFGRCDETYTFSQSLLMHAGQTLSFNVQICTFNSVCEVDVNGSPIFTQAGTGNYSYTFPTDTVVSTIYARVSGYSPEDQYV